MGLVERICGTFNRGRHSRWVAGAIALGLLVGCEADKSPPEAVPTARATEALSPSQAQTFSVTLPQGFEPASVFMSTSDRLQVDDQVVLGTSSELETVANLGPGGLEIGSIATVHANVYNGAGSTFLRSQSNVRGFVRAHGLIQVQVPVTVQGGRFPNTPVPSAVTAWTVNFPSTNAGPIFRGPDLFNPPFPVAPGAYTSFDVQSRSRVALRSGTYYFDSFNTEPQAQVLVDKTNGPIFIYVRNSFRLHGAFIENGGLEAQLLVGVAGTTNVDLTAGFRGTMVAPNAQVDLRRPITGQHKGAFFGRRVEVFSQSNVLHIPFDWGFLCPAGDSDHDGTNDCQDACDFDPLKTSPGLCNCGVSDADADSDGIPNCRDVCDLDANNSVRGQCGCSDNPAPAGTPCSDGPCGPGVCNGAGVCGNPTSCAPEANCFPRRFDNSFYWFCPGPATWDQAAARCRAQPGRRPVDLTTRLENAFVSGVTPVASWIGANDRSAEGSWRWATATNNEGLAFWLGGPGGARTNPSRFESWTGGQPADAEDCGLLGTGDSWSAAACGSSFGYVCEKAVGLPTPPIPDTGGGGGSRGDGNMCDLFPARFCQPDQEDAPDCQPASAVLPATRAELYAQLDSCNAATNCTETDQSGCGACQGAAAVPPPNSRCPAFEAEEQGFCGLQNVIEAGCTPGQHCCSIVEAEPLPVQGFDANVGPFAFVDDAFRSTAQPGYASGARVTTGGNPGAALQVQVGGVDNAVILGMSGGWQTTFTLPRESRVLVSFDYNLTQAAGYEPDEFSQVLLSVDGVLYDAPLGTTDYVDQVVGNGNGGSPITTGFAPMTRNLGVFAAGTHTLRIGAFNNQKTVADELTTVLIDNVRVTTEASDCPTGLVCAPIYPNCIPCNSGEDEGFCDVDCTDTGVRRCGEPLRRNGVTPRTSCASNEIFPDTERCQFVEVCSDPVAPDVSDPTVNPDSDLDPETFNPSEVFDTPADAVVVYPPDPPCATPPCAGGPPPADPALKHRWCVYDVDESVVPGQDVPPDSKRGTSGAETVSFTFDPSVSMDFGVRPMPFGVPTFDLNASASFVASVGFKIGPVPRAEVDVIDALLAVNADRCGAGMTGSHLRIFNFLVPLDGVLPDPLEPPGGTQSCEQAIAAYETAVNRVKKSYRDAIELVEQYKTRLANATSFPEDFCESIVGDAPPGFPVQPCGTEPESATVNRFIDYYENQVNAELFPKYAALGAAALKSFGEPIVLPGLDERETQTLFNVTFPLGPIPMKLELEAFVGYGLRGNVRFELYDGTAANEQSEGPERLAFAEASAGPYALAGMALFVGVGFGVNGFDVSAGVQGDINLGTLGLNNTAGAGIAIHPQPDGRDFPDDITEAAALGAADAKRTLFPPTGPNDYRFSFDYAYGSAVTVSDILRGSIAGRIRIKIAFFSKSWRKVMLRFPGFGPEVFPLISGGGSPVSLGTDDFPLWGTVQMPLPFTELARLPAQALPGTRQPIDTTRVGELFYDGLCECSNINQPCVRDGQCCSDDARCFSNPLNPSTPVCSLCRQAGQVCNDSGDCCNPAQTCLDEPDAFPPGIKVCSCLPTGSSCTGDAQCCSGFDATGLNNGFCEDESNTSEVRDECRRCRHDREECVTADDCCDEGDITECVEGRCSNRDVG